MIVIQVRLELAGIGVSLVATSQEVLYARASGIDLRATSSKIRHTLEAAVRSLQVTLTGFVERGWGLDYGSWVYCLGLLPPAARSATRWRQECAALRSQLVSLVGV